MGREMPWYFVEFQVSYIQGNLYTRNKLMLSATKNFQIMLTHTNFDWWGCGRRTVAQNAESQVAGRKH